ncbi:MAG: serine hydrolase domain-containing protein [Spirochaetota bacterium]
MKTLGRYRKMRKALFLFFRIIIAAFGALAAVSGCLSNGRSNDRRNTAAPAEGCPVAGDETITRILTPIRQKYVIPAIAAAIVTGNGVEHVGAVGVRKWGTDIPITLEDKWHLGSDTKTMTATLVGILVERGLLKWETTVSEVFPEFAAGFHPDLRQVTILQLLSHRAGIPANLNYNDLLQKRTTTQQRIEAVKRGFTQKPANPPGSTFLYSNLGYIIIGAIVERITGLTWEQAMLAEVFAPLKMDSAGFGGLGTPGQIDQPWGHVKSKQPFKENGPNADNPPFLGPAGRVHCTIQDWARFIVDQLRGARGEPALLKTETYRTLQTPPFGGDYALGWAVTERDWGGGTVLNHNGSNLLFIAKVWVAPKRDFAILVCANEGLDASEAMDEVVTQLIQLQSTNRTESP